MQLAGLVHERGLVHQVDRDLIDEVELPLLTAEHSLDAFGGVISLWRCIGQQHLGVFQRVLHTLAPMTVSALVVVEVVLFRRIVLVHQELVREVEADLAERVALARRLIHADLAVGGALHLQPLPLEDLRVARLVDRQELVVDDRLRHVPGRIERDELHRLGEQRRLMPRLADHGAGLPDLLAVVINADEKIRDVELDVCLAEVTRHPAPAFHGGENGVELFDAARAVDRFDGRRVQLAGDLNAV